MSRATSCLLLLILATSLADNLRRLSSYPTPHHQNLLDVSASLRRAQQALSPAKSLDQPQELSDTPTLLGGGGGNNSYTITLHPRSSLPVAHRHGNYTSLTLSRLARDERRVNSILGRRHAPSPWFSSSGYQTPVTSGARQGSGEYFARIGIGRPVKEAYMVIDTGSDVSWLQCEPCDDCYHQTDPVFKPSSSSTYKALSCGSQQCQALQTSACRVDSCLYQVSYGDGSYTVGDFATETISFGSSGQVPGVALGCGHDNEGLFSGADGLLGLGGGALSLPSQIKATSFSYCLVDRDSQASSTLEFNSGQPQDSVLAPMLRNSLIKTYHYVALTGVSVGGRPVNIPASLFDIGNGRGGVIVDSGTAITRLRQEAYAPFRDAFKELTGNLRSSAEGFSLFDTCYDLAGQTTVKVPTVALQFAGGKVWELKATNYLIPVDDAGKFCFAFAGTSGELSIIGNVQQQGTRVSYDMANNYIGFSANKC